MGKSVFMPAEILLPNTQQPEKWPVLACDQFTSQPEYWEKADALVGTAPSTLRIILPEVYLEQEGVEGRIAAIHSSMEEYLKDGLFQPPLHGFVYLRRSFPDGTLREGLVGSVDLEDYSYEPGAQCLIRPSENTVVSRIPPRLAVRRGAKLESPHILMLVDDESNSVIEPLAPLAQQPPLYDIELMLEGGRLQGWAVTGADDIARVQAALEALADPERFAARYGTDANATPFVFAVGDGNHSLATAKAYWEEVKQGLTEEQRQSHPARYCLVELENIQSPAINIEPIHRVIFGTDTATLLHRAAVYAAKNGAKFARGEVEGHHLVVKANGNTVDFTLQNSTWPLAVGAVESFLDEFMQDYPTASVDYVHGDEAVAQLTEGGKAVGILLPPFEKSDLFRGVALGGVLPRKTFSMGHAEQKRYYMECRRLDSKVD